MTRSGKFPRVRGGGAAGRRQVEVLARAFEGGAFDEFFRSGLRPSTNRDERDEIAAENEDAALAAVEEFLGESVLPQTTRGLRLAIGKDSLGRPPSTHGGGPDEATQYLRWLVTVDVDKARKRREGARRKAARDGVPAKKDPGR